MIGLLLIIVYIYLCILNTLYVRCIYLRIFGIIRSTEKVANSRHTPVDAEFGV